MDFSRKLVFRHLRNTVKNNKFNMKPIIKFLEKNQKPCLIKKHFDFDCPGCGMQTSFIELLKGNFVDSFITYPALIPIIILFTFLILHLIFKFTYGSNILIYWFIFTIAITIFSYIYKLIEIN